jgi:hypothetical protein
MRLPLTRLEALSPPSDVDRLVCLPVSAEPPDSCSKGCLTPGMLIVGLILIVICWGAACMRFRKTRSCTDCSPRRAKQMATGGPPSP